MKFIKWILGLFALIGGAIAMFVPKSNSKKVKEIKGKIKDNEKKTKTVNDLLKEKEKDNEAIKKSLDNKKKALKEIEKQRENFGVERKSAAEATSRLRKIGKGKKK